MATYTFNISPLNEYLKNKNNTTISCIDILNIICNCYGIYNKKKVHISSLISQMCKDSLTFKKEDNEYISYLIDIAISLIMINNQIMMMN